MTQDSPYSLPEWLESKMLQIELISMEGRKFLPHEIARVFRISPDETEDD
jgi:hypothetical protein